MPRILIINPNSSVAVTREIDLATAPLRQASTAQIDVLRLEDGPPGIQTQVHVDAVVQPVLQCIRTHAADAYVIACFSDPGLHAAREVTAAPVFGIAECGVLAALQRGARLGIISILAASIPRHMRYLGAMGVMDRVAGDRAIGMGVADLGDARLTFQRMAEAGERLRDLDGADVLVMGCAGMAQHRAPLAAHLGIPVIEPTQAAVSSAIGALALAW